MNLLFIPDHILSYVSGFGIVQAVLLASLIYFHRNSNRSVNIFLASYIFFMSLVMCMPLVIKTFGWQRSYFQLPFPLITGPLLYLYFRSFHEKIGFKQAWPHFAVFVLFYIPTYFHITRFTALYPDAKEVPPALLQNPVTIILNYFKMGQSIVYFFLCRRLLGSYQRSAKNSFSEAGKIDLRWARVLANGFIIVVFSGIVLFGMMIRFPQQVISLLLINMTIATVYIYITAFIGIMQQGIWQLPVEITRVQDFMEVKAIITEKKEVAFAKKARPVMADAKLDDLVVKITELMEKDKLYQETELTLQDISGKLNIPAYQVSQAINERMNKSFYELVNSYRVKEAKQLLLDPSNKNYTVLSVGFEAGFNSKTTFNTVFKKFTGLTPTDYREKKRMSAVA